MITYLGMLDIENYIKMRNLSLSEEFCSLPKEWQMAIVMAEKDNKNKKDEFTKRMSLWQYNLEEKSKEKVLTLLKKKRWDK